ncbi:MAG: TonB-dependent siderophore receptor [Pseudomonas sp.]|uniref:TonB-dependent siderophore receptor n=1 Tax=Pseudomonas abieticivorans TaxID=2931382 RepID=UPI0020C020F5|nr:TonB-dependent siderophore receptor [Pseudomonas sp. PIA16]MDE1168439.1 TonB-dependent siderophore receptor [Pseudomonas sp.]
MTRVPRSPVPRLALSAIAAMLLTPAWADTGTINLEATSVQAALPVTEDGYQPPEVATTLKGAAPLSEQPQSVSVVSQQVIKDYAVTSLDDAMKFVSGVTQGNTLGGTEDGFVKRGFGANSDGSILRDGVRSSQGLNFDATTDSVEVLKGSASLLYGILNPGGVINVISKKPQYQWQREISLRSSSFGGGAGTVDITGPLGDTGFAFRLIAERQHEDYWRNFGVDSHTLVAPSLTWTGDRAKVTASYEELKYDIPYDRGTAFINGKAVDIPYNRRLDDYANHAWGKTKTLNLSGEYQVDDTWTSRLTYAWNQRKYDSNEVRATAINTTTGAVTRRADANRGFNNQTDYAAWDWIGSPQWLGLQHDVLVGTDWERNRTYKAYSYRGKTTSTFNMYSPVYGTEPVLSASTYSDSLSNLATEIENNSLYFKDSIHLTDRWIAVVGARWQHYQQTNSNGYVTPTTTLDTSDNKFLPQLGLVYKLTEDVSLYGNYSRSFTPSDSVDDEGNVASPELGRSYEVGSKWAISPRLVATLALYQIDEQDMSIFINGVTRPIPKARSRGIELELNGEIAPTWDITANLSYDKTEITEDNINPANVGNQLVNAPKNMAGLYLSHTLQLQPLPGEFRVGGGARYVSERAGDPENSFYMPAYTVADSFIAWDNKLFGNHTQLKLNVKNLFNREYYSSSAGNLRVIVGEPRSTSLEATVDF